MTQIKALLKKYSPIPINETQLDLFERFYDLVRTYNQHTNLTTIIDEKAFVIKHIIDSIWILEHIHFDKNSTIADVGTGPGFPGVPLIIMRPDLKMTLIDSNNKKIQFLNLVKKELSLEVTIENGRAEIYAKANQNKFNYIVSRAVSSLRELVEINIPMLKSKGHFFAYKSQKHEDEVLEAKRTLLTLSSRIQTLYKKELPEQAGERIVLDIVKQKHIQGFPRTYQQIKKKGL